MKTEIKKKKVKEAKSKIELEWEIEPQIETWSSATCHTWTTICKRYRAYRINSVGGEPIKYGSCARSKGGWWPVEWNDRLGTGYPKYYTNLADALAAAEWHLNDQEEIKTNAGLVLARAKKLNLLERGYNTVKTPRQAVETNKTPKPPMTAPEARQTHASAQQTGKSTNQAKTQARGRVKGVKTPWGCRPGSNEDKAISVLTTTPKNMKEIMRDAGLLGSVYNFMNKLVKEERIKKCSEGYYLK